MRRIAFVFLAASALSAGGTQITFAADIPVKAPAAVRAAAVYNWTGFYFGAYVGGVWGTTDVARNDNLFPPVQTDPRGVALGGLLGYNFQSGQAVFGIEADAGWLSAQRTSSAFTTTTLNQTAKIDFEGRVRGRLGYAWDRTLPFVAGGMSFGHQKVTIELPASATTTTISKSHTGWNIGGGVDYAFQQNLIGRVEYIYDRFSDQGYAFLAPSGGAIADRSAKFNTNTVRAALIYRF